VVVPVVLAGRACFLMSLRSRFFFSPSTSSRFLEGSALISIFPKIFGPSSF
jgi:hypothetical protein